MRSDRQKWNRARWPAGDRQSVRRPESPNTLADLTRILRCNPPPKLPVGLRTLSRQLREDDALARRVWSHSMYIDLVGWVRQHYPQCPDAWEEMAIYGLARARECESGRCTPAQVRAGMVDTARWVAHRGRHGERQDESVSASDTEQLFDRAPVADVAHPVVAGHWVDPVDYLVVALDAGLPATARDLIDQAWDIAQEHFVMLARVTGLQGEALLAEGQSRDGVNRARRLSGQLPRDWPPAVRKAVVHLFAGTPRNPGLLLLWATTDPGEVPVPIRRRWRGLVAVIDPLVGRLPDTDRRRLRDQARRWAPSTPTPAGIAV